VIPRLREELGTLDVGEVLFDEPLARHISFRTGGAIDALVTVPDVERWGRLLAWSRGNKVPLVHLGQGRGLVVRSTGLDGVAVSTRLVNQVTREEEATSIRVRAGAGAPVLGLAGAAAHAGAGGLEPWVGSEGSVGGLLRRSWPAVRPWVASVALLGDRGKVRIRTPDEIGERLRLPGRTAVAWASFDFGPRTGEALFDDGRFTMDGAAVRDREDRGTVRLFNAPEGEDPALVLGDLGVRGIRLREVAIDEGDPNRASNRGEGTTEDLWQLVQYVRQRASQRGGVELTPAFRILGKK